MTRLMRTVRTTIDQPQLPTCAVHPAQEAHEGTTIGPIQSPTGTTRSSSCPSFARAW